jgi:hypothetical protein
MSISTQSSLQSAGEINIEQLFLVSNTGTSLSLLDYLVELNIYESIFNNVLSGDILLSDSRNLIKELNIIGEEYLVVKVSTPGLPNSIYKTFKVTSVEDRVLVKESTQIYKLKFISQEALEDSLQPVYNAYSGQVDTIVNKIFTDNLNNVTRNFIYNDVNNKLTAGKDKTELVIFSEAANKVKFVSPGWTPFQCLNWLAKKTLPKTNKACNFLFWESNRSFYFGSLEDLFEQNRSIGSYEFKATGVKGPSDDTIEKMTLIQTIDILNGLDHLSNLENGYFASKLVSIDIFKKQRAITDYDHVTRFSSYKHVAGKNNMPLFKNVDRNLNSHTRVYPTSSKLHTGIENNFNERMGELYGNRLSNLIELNSLKLNISIYGRTDVEAGRIIDIKFPDMSPVNETDKTSEHLDNRYSGSYLITSIHHKINILKHTMSMEIVRDSLSPSPAESNYSR